MKRSLLIVLGLFLIAIVSGLFFFKESAYKPVINALSLDEDASRSGVRFIKKEISIDGDVVSVSLVKVNIGIADIGITSPAILERKTPNAGYSGYSLQEYLQLGRYKVVQSGGFLSSWSPPHPLGYVKIQGKEYSKIHESWLTKGVFCTNGDSFIIEEYKSPEQFSAWLSCLQAGPPILLNKKDVLDKARNTGYVTKEKHRQSFLCKSQDGDLLMGVAEDVILTKFIATMQSSEEDGGLGCVDAVLMTSKGIAGILANINDDILEVGNTEVPLPNAIVVK